LSMTQGFHRWPLAGGLGSPLYQMWPWRANPGAGAQRASGMMEGGVRHCLHGGAGRERNSKSRTKAKLLPPPAATLRVVLEFEFLSRIIASMQSMTRCRRGRRLSPMCKNQDCSCQNHRLAVPLESDRSVRTALPSLPAAAKQSRRRLSGLSVDCLVAAPRRMIHSPDLAMTEDDSDKTSHALTSTPSLLSRPPNV
jgi:hypothetical protein